LENFKQRDSLKDPCVNWKENIKTDLREIGHERIEWVQGWNLYSVLVNVIMESCVLQMQVAFKTAE
jgi:hypothetical protein